MFNHGKISLVEQLKIDSLSRLINKLMLIFYDYSNF